MGLFDDELAQIAKPAAQAPVEPSHGALGTLGTSGPSGSLFSDEISQLSKPAVAVSLGGTTGLQPESYAGSCCGDALANYLNAGPLRDTGLALPQGGIGPGDLANVGRSRGASVMGRGELTVDNLTPGTVIHMTRKPGDKNYEYGDTHIGIVDADESGGKVFKSYTAGKGWRADKIDENFIAKLPAQITATNPVSPPGVQTGSALYKAQQFLNRSARQFPIGTGETVEGITVPPLPEPAQLEKPVEPATWKEIQDPFASSLSLAMEHPEESIDPFAKGFADGLGWGFVPELGKSERALGFIPTNMYAFGHDVGMIVPILLSMGFVAPAATAVGATGMGTGLGAEILTPFAQSVLGGAFYGAQERTNELLRDSISGKPTPSTMQAWGQILGNAYNNALGFALAHSGVNATFGELSHFLGVRKFNKLFKDPVVQAAGSPEALQMAAAKDPSLSEVAKKSPEAAGAISYLNKAAQEKLNADMGTVLDAQGRPITEATKALEKQPWERNALEKFQAEGLEADRLGAFRAGELPPVGEIVKAPAYRERAEVGEAAVDRLRRAVDVVGNTESGRQLSEFLDKNQGEIANAFRTPDKRGGTQETARRIAELTHDVEVSGDPNAARKLHDYINSNIDAFKGLPRWPYSSIATPYEPFGVSRSASITDSMRAAKPAASAEVVKGSLDNTILGAAKKIPPSTEPTIDLAEALSRDLEITFDEADALVKQSMKEGLIRFREGTDGMISFTEGPKVKPVAVVTKNVDLPEGMAPKSFTEPDGTNWNQAGVYVGPEGGLRHEFYVVADPQTAGGFRFMEKIFKGDVALKTNNLITGDVGTIARYMENAMHPKWQNAYRFPLNEVGGTTMYGGIPIDQFVPMMRKLAPARALEIAKNVYKELHMTLSPESISMGGQKAAQGMREYHARIRQGIGQRERAWDAYRQEFDRMSPEERLGFIDGPLREYETTGKVSDPAYEPLLRAYKEATDKMVAAIETTTGKTFPYKEFYFRHIWEDDPKIIKAAVDMFEAQGANGYYDPVAIKEFVASLRAGQAVPPTEAINTFARNRSLEGGKSFLRKRSIPTMADGVSWGLQTMSDNPVDIILVDMMQKHRYLLGQNLFKQLKSEGLVRYSQTQEIPPDWVPIEDKIAQVWHYVNRPGGALIPAGEERPMGGGPERAGYWEVPAVKGMMQGGKFYAPPEVAAIVNRDLSPGLKGSKIYQLYRTPTDMLNQIAVAWSGYHWMFETLSSMFIGAGRGFKLTYSGIMEGNPTKMMKGIKELAIENPLAAPISIMRNVKQGGKILDETYAPDFSGLDTRSRSVADFAMRAGGSGGHTNKGLRDSMAESLSNAWQDVIGRHPVKLAKHITELVAKPLMEWYVPRVKMATFARLLEGDLEAAMAKAGGPLSQTEQSLVAMNTWQHIDNIFGQLVYDNLHFSKALRDGMFMFVRFPGWNIGSVRSLVATGRGVAKLATGRKLDFQAEVALEYALGMATNLSLLGTLTNYALTGEFPKTGQDLIEPRDGTTLPDGTPGRVWFASYLRDYMGFVHEPAKEIAKGNPLGAPGKVWNTISAKMAPIPRLAYEILANKDYFGKQVFTPGAGIARQAGELLGHVGSEYTVPFGVQQASKAGSTPSAIANAAGITSVPRRYLRSPAQEVISEYNALKRGTQTKSEAEKSDFRRSFIDAIRKGDAAEAREVAQEAMKKLRFAPEDFGKMVKDAKEHPLVHGFKTLPLEWALKVYREADDQERKLLGPAMGHKLQVTSGVEKMRLKSEIMAVFADIKSKKEAPRRVAGE